MRANRAAVWLLMGVCALAAATAQAHGVRLSAQSQGDRVIGQVRYADDMPLRSARVELREVPQHAPTQSRDPTTQEAIAWQTFGNDAGEFVFEAVAPGDYQLSAEDGLGHRASLRVSMGRGAVSQDWSSSEPSRWRDVLAGLGYLLGLFGLLAWMSARRQVRA